MLLLFHYFHFLLLVLPGIYHEINKYISIILRWKKIIKKWISNFDNKIAFKILKLMPRIWLIFISKKWIVFMKLQQREKFPPGKSPGFIRSHIRPIFTSHDTKSREFPRVLSDHISPIFYITCQETRWISAAEIPGIFFESTFREIFTSHVGKVSYFYITCHDKKVELGVVRVILHKTWLKIENK